MIEKFEDRQLTGKINVACKFEGAPTRYWNTTKEEVIDHIQTIVNQYRAQGYVLTLRQLHYQLVTRNWIVNHDSAYKKLGNILDDCRYAGIIDWEAIEDRGRIPFLPYQVDDVPDALEDTIDTYRLDRQRNQDIVVELWSEKDALSGILRRTTSKYHIRLVVNKGYTSSTALYNSYRRVLSAVSDSKKFLILYFGDHDPSGLDMVRDIRERIEFMLTTGAYGHIFRGHNLKAFFEVRQIGLTMDQIRRYAPPANPTKLTDSRAAGYISQFGQTCWEVDALNPQTLTQIVETNIQGEIDMNKYQEMLDLEASEKDELRDIVDDYNNKP